jgi:hypothetical protein
VDLDWINFVAIGIWFWTSKKMWIPKFEIFLDLSGLPSKISAI